MQFLSVQSPSAPVDKGLQSAAAKLNAVVAQLTVNQADVERVAGRAQSNLKAVSGIGEGQRWQDAGYRLLPVIALFALMWSRRGWLVR